LITLDNRPHLGRGDVQRLGDLVDRDPCVNIGSDLPVAGLVQTLGLGELALKTIVDKAELNQAPRVLPLSTFLLYVAGACEVPLCELAEQR